MNFKNFQQRRDFLKAAAGVTVGGGLPTLEALTHVAHAAGGTEPTQVGSDYKAIVCVFLYGGQDSANILIPYQDGDAAGTATATTTVEFDRYAHDRSNFTAANPAGDAPNQKTGNLAYTRDLLAATALPASTVNSVSKPGGWTTNTHGRQFALHPNYAELKAIYDTGKLAVIANVGSLVAPITRAQWYGPSASRPPRPLNLYSHDDQQKSWLSGTANVANPSVGIGGRIASHAAITALNAGAKVPTQISVDGSNTFMLTDLNPTPSAIAYQIGVGGFGRVQSSTATPPVTSCNTSSSFVSANPSLPYCVSGGPIALSSAYFNNTQAAPLKNAFLSRMNSTTEGSSVYSDQWRQTMRQSIDTQSVIATAFLNSPPTEEIVAPFVPIIANNYLAAQLRMVAAMIRASSQLGAGGTPLKRQIFFVGLGGFDTHGGEFWTSTKSNNAKISKAIDAFWTAMGNVNVIGGVAGETARDHVTLFTMSEFGRTLDSNSGGTDHGWGTHQIVLGGAVKGGKIYGQNHNVTVAPAGTASVPAYLQLDSTAGAVPRVGLPPSPYTGATRIANQLNHSLQRGELLPTTSSDAVVATIAQWFGVPVSDLTGGPKPIFPTLTAAHPGGFDMGFMG